MRHFAVCFLIALSGSLTAQADPAQIVSAEVRSDPGGRWTVSATVLHPDTGWDHYANGWEVLAPDGTSLGVRELLHPHEHEQPFTRSLGNINVPDGIKELTIRARCSVDGWGAARIQIDLNR